MLFYLHSAAECVSFYSLFFLVLQWKKILISRWNRVVIRFFAQNGKSPKETIDELCNVYAEDELLSAPTIIYWWHKEYQEGRQSFTLWQSSKQLASQITHVNVNTISLVIKEDRQLTIQDLEHMTSKVSHSLYPQTKSVNTTWVIDIGTAFAHT